MVTAQSGGGGATRSLNNLKSVSINLPKFPVPRLVLENDGTELEPAISFSSSPDTGIFLRASEDLAFVSEGTEGLRVSHVPDARNCLVVIPSVLGSGPIIAVDGEDTDISINLLPKNAGRINVLSDMNISGTLGLGTLIPPNPSAILELNSTTKGFLLPRMTSTERLAISSPATGLQVYDITEDRIFLFDGIAWRATSGVFTTTKSIDAGRAGFSGSADADTTVINNKSLVVTFVSNQLRSAYFTEDLPASYVDGSDIEVTFIWSPDDASAGDVVWGAELTMVTPDSGDTLDGPSTIITIVETAPGVAFEAKSSATIVFDGTGITKEDFINLRIFRDGSDGLDTYSKLAHISVVALKFQLSG